MSKSGVLVSVCVITYNHEAFIEDTINSILNQVCDFQLEVIISNDASIDNTLDRILSFKNHPKWGCVKLINHNHNIGVYQNLINTLKQCKGDYISFCEGDDYWYDPLKLQKQISFLESNQDFGSCFTQYIRFFEKTNSFDTINLPILPNIDSNLNGMVVNLDNFNDDWYTQLVTSMFRKEIINNIDLSIYKYPRDNHLCYHAVKLSKSICLNFTSSVYRKHDGGIYSGVSERENFVNHYYIYEELYINNKNDNNLKKQAFLMISKLIETSSIKFLINFYFHINLEVAKYYFFSNLPRSAKCYLFLKVSLREKNKLFVTYWRRKIQ